MITSDTNERMNPATDIYVNFGAGEIGFDCPCGECDLVLCEHDDEKTCACGRVYRLVHRIMIKGDK